MSKAKAKDPGKAAVEWMERLPLAGDYLGQKLKLRPWQREIIETIFKTDKNGRRIVRKIYVSFPRKHAKTMLCALINLYCLVYPKMGDQELYSCAWSRDQAAKVFEYMSVIINQVPWLRDRCKIGYQKKEITFIPKMNRFRSIAASPETVHGLSGNVITLDELHVWSGAKAQLLYDGLTTGQGARKDPLQIIITTAGHNQSQGNLCYQEYCYAKKWLSGEIDNPNYAAFIYEAEKDSDPFDEEVWKKACPALGDFVNLDFYRSQAEIAKKMPSKLNGFKQLYLNMWVDSTFSWIPSQLWEEGSIDYTEKDLLGEQCYAGFDWGLTKDMTSLVLLFPMPDGTFRTLTYVWIPQATVEERALSDDLRFKEWVKKGIVKVTPGAATDHDTVKKDILALRDRFYIKLLAGDPFACGETLQFLNRQGVRTHAIQQSSIAIISAGAKHLEALILNGRLKHQISDEVLTWCVNNATIKVDHYENIRPIKSSESGRIDPVICLTMAVAVATVIQQHAEITVN